MNNLNIRGNNMPRRKKKIVNKNFNFTKKTEQGQKYNKLITQINTIINDSYDPDSETNSNKYNSCKEHILDSLQEFGDTFESYDILKKSIFSYKNDIKDDRLEFSIHLLLENSEHPYQFKSNIYDSIFIKNFDQEWLHEIPFKILNELHTSLSHI